MIGTIRWNVYGGLAAFLLTFLVSVSRNVWTTCLLRSVYSFIIVFLILYAFRFVMKWIVDGNGTAAGPVPSVESEDISDLMPGQHIDIVTPGDEDLPFTPLQPPKLTTKPDLPPEELANALRRMSEE